MQRVLVCGAGFAGMYTALRLQKRLAAGGHRLTVVNPENFMTYQPFLPEAASGAIEPRHVVVALRQVLRHASFVAGEVVSLDHRRRIAAVHMVDGEETEIAYDHVVLTPGSVSRVLPIPGLGEHGVGFKTVTEAIHLRNQVLSRLEVAAATGDPERRRSALTFVFVGGGYAGVEALAELEDLARAALRWYPGIKPADMRWVLVEAADDILYELGRDLARYVRGHLKERGIEILLNTRLESAAGGTVGLSDGQSFRADTLVWTAGGRPHPVVSRSGFDLDASGRVVVDEFLRVPGTSGAWSAGDCAAVPDYFTGGFCPPTAQHSIRQARLLARNVLASLDGREPKPFRYRNRGQLASLGRHKGVASPMGIPFRGFTAWWLHRTYHLSKMPTLNRKVRIALDWTVGLLFPREVVQLGSLQRPREPLVRAMHDPPP